MTRTPKSPFFPARYPVNSYCETYIDVDNARDVIEFKVEAFDFRQGDFLYLYIGDSVLSGENYDDDWVEYRVFSRQYAPKINDVFYICFVCGINCKTGK